MAVNWKKIKAEYITQNTSYRKLAEKYGVTKDTINRHAAAENWKAEKADYKRRCDDKVKTEAINLTAETAVLLHKIALNMAKQLTELSEMSPKKLAALGVKPKDITSAAKDIEDITHIKSEADAREQEARIASLRKRAETAEDKEIKITIAGTAAEYGK